MYGLSKDTDLTFLLQKKLEKVESSKFQVQLHFEGAICLSVEGECNLDGNSVNFDQLHVLGGKTVYGVTIDEQGTLAVFFTTGERLSVFDSSAEYECYNITAPGVHIVV